MRPLMDQICKCPCCGEVIGVYEPLIVVEDSGPRSSSFAAEPQLARAGGERYHRACYAALPQRDRAPDTQA
jgi:hypothetical protein